MARLRLSLVLFFVFAFSLLPSAVAQKAKGQFVLVIDAGHGGRDHGAPGKLTLEKHINLNVALAFGKLVENNFKDVKVIYTRKTDVFVPLQTRAEIANRNKADLFVSIHTNAVERNKTAVSGAETYSLGMHRSAENLEVAKRENSVITQESNYQQTYQNFDPRKAESYIIFELMQDRNMKQSVSMAQCIQQQYAKEGRRNKGVKQAGFLVLHATSMPSVLTELGFISHPDEERFLHSKEGVEKLARALYNGFRNYRRQQRGTAEELLPEAMEAPRNLMAESTIPNELSSPAANAASPATVQTTPAPRPQLCFMELPLSAATQTATNGREQLAAASEFSETMAAVVPVATRPFRSVASSSALAATDSGFLAQPTLATSIAEKSERTAPAALPVISDTSATTTVENLRMEVENVAQAVEQLAEAPRKVAKPKEKKALPKEEPIEIPKPKSGEAKKVVEPAKPKVPETPKQKPAEVKKTSDTSKAKSAGRDKTSETAVALPEFRVQILTSDRQLRTDDRHFKGLTPITFYQENGHYKYTHGATNDLSEAQRLKKKIAADFPEAFVVALLDGKRMDLRKAKEIISTVQTTSKN